MTRCDQTHLKRVWWGKQMPPDSNQHGMFVRQHEMVQFTIQPNSPLHDSALILPSASVSLRGKC
jgi:hypothetical protein